MKYTKIGPVKAVRVSVSFILIYFLIWVQIDMRMQSSILEFSENMSRAHHLKLIAREYKMTISSTKKNNDNMGEPYTEGKNCDKRQNY